MRAVLYARVSTTDQTVDAQLGELRAHVEARGWTLVEEYVDEGESGASRARPALIRMLKDLRGRRRVEVVCVWKLDRLGRSLAHLVDILGQLDQLGVGFVSLRDGAMDTTTPAGRLLFQLVGAFAEFEREQLRHRTKAGMAAAKRRGVHIGRPKRAIDLDVAMALFDGRRSVSEVARMLRVPRATLRVHLDEAGLLDVVLDPHRLTEHRQRKRVARGEATCAEP